MTNVDEAATASGDSADRSGDEASRRSPRKKSMPLWQETILLLGLALVLAIIIKSLFVQAFYIPSPSMEPLFIKNDRILVQKVSYWGGASPSRGDIVVFKDPGGWLNEADTTTPAARRSPRCMEKVGLYPTGGHLVKRVIGVGGDRVVCCDAKGRITVNGKALDEKAYLPKGTAPSQIKFDRTVPKDHLWMMGDNRSLLLRLPRAHGRPGRRVRRRRTSSSARCSR